MRPSTSRPFRLAIAVAIGAALALTACGDDDSSGGGSGGDGDSAGDSNVEVFCAALAEFIEAPDEGDEANLAALREVAEVAPDEVSDDFDTLVSLFERLQDVDLEGADDEQLADFEAAFQQFDEATASAETYARDNCPDLPASVFDE